MRQISLERIGQYLKTCINIIKQNGGSISAKDLIKEMSKVLKDLNEIELAVFEGGSPRWIVVFRFWTIGLVKGGYIKKVKNVWYLTDKGNNIVNLKPLELTHLSREAYLEWKENKDDEQKEDLSLEDAAKYIDENQIMQINDPLSNMKIKPDIISFDEILRGVDKGLIQISPFQREFVWSAKAIQDLLDSIYRGYPIGSFIFWKTSKRLPYHRKIGGLDLSEAAEGTNIDYVLDGQQRITSLYAAVKGARIEEMYYKFYFDLSIGKFDYSKIDKNSETEKTTKKDSLRVPLEKLFVDGPSYRRYMREFPDKFQNILDTLYVRFKDYAFSVIYVIEENENTEKNDIKKITNIFTRINETGKKLTIVAKMIARCWGEGYDLRGKLNDFFKSEELQVLREETILHAASVILNNKKSRSKNILEDTKISELESQWDSIVSAINQALDFLKDNIRIKNFRYLPFDSIIVPLSYFYYINQNPSAKQKQDLFKWFWKACLSNRFSSTVESKIEKDCYQLDDLLANKEVEFNYSIDWETFNLRLIQQNYYQKNAFCLTVLCLYSYMQPKNFKDNSDIDLVKNFSDYSKHNLHHFFPKAFLDEINDPNKDEKDSIVNIAFAPSITNIEIGKQGPSTYIGEFSKDNKQIDETLKTHLIDSIKDFGLEDDNFNKFLERRANKIRNEFRRLLGLTSQIEQDLEHKPSLPIDELEIKMRQFLDHQLSIENENYWDEVIPIDIKDSVERKIEHELRTKPYEHEKFDIPSEKLNFLDIMDYQKIILYNWNIFSAIFKSRGQIEKHFSSLNEFRNAIKHVKPMDEVIKRNGEAAVIWFDRILNSIEF